MKELKFRAWDGEDMYIPEIQENEQGENINDWFASFRNVTLMQYTGLKDKSGKEIYEGDIVVYVEDVIVETIEGHHRYEREGQIGSVNFENGAFYVDGGGFYLYGEQMFLWAELEVIGNIYENPELLTN